MSSDGAGGKKKRLDKKEQHQKQQEPKAALPRWFIEASSSQTMHAPCQDGACAGTSASGSSSLTEIELSVKELEKIFYKLKWSKVLQGTKLTEKQNEILQKSFAMIALKSSITRKNAERFLKTHKCKRCDFSMSHQCMTLDYIRSIPYGTELMNETAIGQDRTVICDCRLFAFSHAHLKRTRTPVVNLEPRRVPYLPEYSRTVELSCPKCLINIIMTNRRNEVCCDVIRWDSITAGDREAFYKNVQSCLHNSAMNPPLLDEFYYCSRGCCLIFHRCPVSKSCP